MSKTNSDTLLDRVSIAIQAAGINCFEYSYVEDRFTWFDGLPADIDLDGSEAERAARRLAASILPEDDAAVRSATERALAAGEDTLTSTLRRRDAQGNIRHYSLYQRFFRDSAGRPARAIGATRDITAEVLAAESLRHQSELLRETERRIDRASMSSQEGHWEVELPTRKHWASKSYLALLGYAPDSDGLDTLDKVRSIIHPDDAAALYFVTRRHLAGGPAYDAEARLRSLDGHYRWFRVRGTAEWDADGHALRLSGSVHDIQKQRMAEDELREVQARFARAVNGTQDGLWEVDLDRRKMWLSPKLSKLLGYEEGELSESQDVLRTLVHPEDVAATDAIIEASMEGNLALDFEVRMRTKSGEHRWYRMRGTPPVDYGAQGRRSSGSMQDVTEPRAARDVLILATESAQAANRAKSGFLANVSHEIRTPMNGIIGMARLLLDTSLDPTQRDFTDTIRSSADSLLNVINDILDFSKIEAGKMDIEALEMDLPANVDDIGAIMAFQAAAKNLELIVNVHPDVPHHVLGDPQRIRQCVINLIGNAIKFTASGEIVCEVTVVESSEEAVQVRFAVHDTGIGIAPEMLDALFQPFTQADASTTRHYGGTGLGLSIVHRMAEIMGGRTGATSAIGKGSTFWFTLPMKRAARPVLDGKAETSAGRRLLVIDDNETNRRALRDQLSYAGYAVTLAASGAEALIALRLGVAAHRPFDAALIDFQMPDMDGAMVGQAIGADPQLSRTRVVLLTSMDRQGDVGRFAAMGFAGYLPKPVKARDLLACLRRVLKYEAHEWHLRTQPIVTPNALAPSSHAGRFAGKVLLVEDNIVNQKVARRFLERLGCEVTVAENGEQGVKLCLEGGYRLVLMDVQMPIMDGYAAARMIRGLAGSDKRIPIVALTANAMAGQLERCIEAGMDALLTKPLDVDQLKETLGRFGLSADPEPPSDTALAPAPAMPAVNFDRLREITGGETDFAADLVRSYLNSSGELLGNIRACVASGDRRELAHAVHQLGGASANVQALDLGRLCATIERAAHAAGAAELTAFMAQLTAEACRVDQAFADPANGFSSTLLTGAESRA